MTPSQRRDQADCDHDWRVNPHMILPTFPPQRQHVCAKCGARKPSGTHVRGPKALSHDPKDWPRA